MPYLIAALIVLAVLAAAIFLGAAAALYCNVMRRGIAKLNERKLRRGVEPTPYRRQAAENAPLWEELEKQTQTLRADDGAILTAHFIPADRPTRRAALVLHGYDCTAQTLAAIPYMLHQNGFAVLMPEQRANGPSEGKATTFGALESRDALLWLARLQELCPDCGIAIYGNSMGAATALLTGAKKELPDAVQCIVSDCSYTSFEDMIRLTLRRMPRPLVWLLLGAVKCLSRPMAGFSMCDTRPIDAVRSIPVPVLFIHGADDTFVPTAMGRQLFKAKTGLKELLVIEGAAHAVSFMVDPPRVTAAMLDFFARYMK